jgi:hypothetical protein
LTVVGKTAVAQASPAGFIVRGGNGRRERKGRKKYSVSEEAKIVFTTKDTKITK